MKRFEILEIHPGIGKMVPEFQNKLIREILEGHYRIIHRIENANTIFPFEQIVLPATLIIRDSSK